MGKKTITGTKNVYELAQVWQCFTWTMRFNTR